MERFIDKLRGGDLRSVGKANEVVAEVLRNPSLFEQLLKNMLNQDPTIAMRAADVVEKVTKLHPGWLQPHKKLILDKIAKLEQQEVRWHVAQIVPRLQLTVKERKQMVAILLEYMKDKSRIVQTCSLEALVDLATEDRSFHNAVEEVMKEALSEGSSAVKSRAKKLLSKMNFLKKKGGDN